MYKHVHKSKIQKVYTVQLYTIDYTVNILCAWCAKYQPLYSRFTLCTVQ